jgi:hypothetical protein
MIGYSVKALKSLISTKNDESSKQIANQVRFIVPFLDDNNDNDKQADYLTINCPRERKRQIDMR